MTDWKALLMRSRHYTLFALQLNQCPAHNLPALSELSLGFSDDGIWLDDRR